MIQDVLDFVRLLHRTAAKAAPSPYNKGYTEALGEVEEYIASQMWENGIDDTEDD